MEREDVPAGEVDFVVALASSALMEDTIRGKTRRVGDRVGHRLSLEEIESSLGCHRRRLQDP